MTNWYNIVIPIAAVVLGFLLRILYQRLFEKKVSLSHKLDAPAVFSVIPPKISFQNLKITNKGKLPAKNLRINLKADVIKRHEATYKPITEEQYEEEDREGILTLRFDTLLPEEELVISFKSSEPIPEDFLINIKSDEMFSKNEADQKRRSEAPEVILSVLGTLAVGVGIIILSNYLFIKLPSRVPFSLSLMKDKSIYEKGQKAEVTCQIVNLKKDLLSDILGELKIPGFDLDTKQKYFRKNFLESEGQIAHKVSFDIPKDMPSGKYKITLEVYGTNLEKTFIEKTYSFFEVQ